MAATTTARNILKSKQSAFSVSKVSAPARPNGLDGIVNIDNISDREYEMVLEILDNTVERQIYWRPQSFLSMLKDMLANKKPTNTYFGSYKNMNITLSSDIKGKTIIKISKKFTNKAVLETFIPFKPQKRMGHRIGTARSQTLYNLFKTVRFKVDGELLAS